MELKTDMGHPPDENGGWSRSRDEKWATSPGKGEPQWGKRRLRSSSLVLALSELFAVLLSGISCRDHRRGNSGCVIADTKNFESF